MSLPSIHLIYLACPFRHNDPFVQKKRCAATHYMATKLSQEGRHVFSPLTHNEPLMDMAPAIPGEHWMQFDLHILAVCKELYVIKLEGWEQSNGVRREIAFAKERGIPITMVEAPREQDYLPYIRETVGIDARKQ